MPKRPINGKLFEASYRRPRGLFSNGSNAESGRGPTGVRASRSPGRDSGQPGFAGRPPVRMRRSGSPLPRPAGKRSGGEWACPGPLIGPGGEGTKAPCPMGDTHPRPSWRCTSPLAVAQAAHLGHPSPRRRSLGAPGNASPRVTNPLLPKNFLPSRGEERVEHAPNGRGKRLLRN